MTSVASAAERIYLGMDVSRDKIAVAVLWPGEDVPAVEVISHDGEMVRRLIGKFADRSVLAACYEAGPGGYELYRQLAAAGVACDVVAPALIPKGAANRVKTDLLTELLNVSAAQASWLSQQPTAGMSGRSESPGRCGPVASPVATETGHTRLPRYRPEDESGQPVLPYCLNMATERPSPEDAATARRNGPSVSG